MNLFKRFCAVITIIAIIASFGVTAFAVETPAVTIKSVATALKSAGVYTVTITYDATAVGDMGVTMLSYLSASGSLEESDTFNQDADPAMYVAGIDQWTVENGTGLTKSFDVKVGTPGTGSVAYGATNLVMMGGDGVTGADIATYAIQWDATAATVTTENLAVSGLEYGASNAKIAKAVEDAFAAGDIEIEVTDGTHEATVVAGAKGVTANVTGTKGDYEVSFTIPVATEETGIVITGNVAKSASAITTPAVPLTVGTNDLVATTVDANLTEKAMRVSVSKLAEFSNGETEATAEEIVAAAKAYVANAITGTTGDNAVAGCGIVLGNGTHSVTVTDAAALEDKITAETTDTYDIDAIETEDQTLTMTITAAVGDYGEATLVAGEDETTKVFESQIALTIAMYVDSWNAEDVVADPLTVDVVKTVTDEKVLAAVQAKLAVDGVSIDFTGNDRESLDTVVKTADGISIKDNEVTGGDGVYECVLVLPAGPYGSDGANLESAEEVALAINVNALKVTAATVTLPTDIDVDATVGGNDTETLGNIKAALEAALESAEATATDASGNSLTFSLEESTVSDVTGDAAVGTAKTFTATVTYVLTASDANDIDVSAVTSGTLTFTVDIKPAFTYGNVNGVGGIDVADLLYLRMRLVNNTPNDFVEEAANIHNPGTTGVDVGDLLIMRKKLVNQSLELPVVE